MRHETYGDDDDVCEYDLINWMDEFIACLKSMEDHNARLEDARACFRTILRNEPKIAKVWSEFMARGGLTASEFRAFIEGQPFRHRLVKSKKHLRVIASTKVIGAKLKANRARKP